MTPWRDDPCCGVAQRLCDPVWDASCKGRVSVRQVCGSCCPCGCAAACCLPLCAISWGASLGAHHVCECQGSWPRVWFYAACQVCWPLVCCGCAGPARGSCLCSAPCMVHAQRSDPQSPECACACGSGVKVCRQGGGNGLCCQLAWAYPPAATYSVHTTDCSHAHWFGRWHKYRHRRCTAQRCVLGVLTGCTPQALLCSSNCPYVACTCRACMSVCGCGCVQSVLRSSDMVQAGVGPWGPAGPL